MSSESIVLWHVLLVVVFCFLFPVLITEETCVYFIVFQQYRDEQNCAVIPVPNLALAVLVNTLFVRLHLKAEWLRVESNLHEGPWLPLWM